jgi:hypothetical protein
MTSPAPTSQTNQGCYCLCAVAHPGADGICQPANAVTTREVNGHPVHMCVNCAARHDARRPAPPARPAPSADGDAARAARAVAAEQTRSRARSAEPDDEHIRAALAEIRAACDRFPRDPAEALKVITDSAAALRAIVLRPAAPVFRQAGV